MTGLLLVLNDNAYYDKIRYNFCRGYAVIPPLMGQFKQMSIWPKQAISDRPKKQFHPSPASRTNVYSHYLQ